MFFCIPYRTIQDPASQRLTWYKPPLTVLVIKKVRDAAVISPFIQLVQWLINEKRMVVFVESAGEHFDEGYVELMNLIFVMGW